MSGHRLKLTAVPKLTKPNPARYREPGRRILRSSGRIHGSLFPWLLDHMRTLLLSTLLVPLATAAQTVELDWPNLPCTTLLHCDSGCTACNMAESTSPGFIGTNLGHVGVDICPLPIGGGDNMLATYGWSAIPDDDHRVFVSFIAFEAMHIDSLIIRHRADGDGPERVQVRSVLNGTQPALIGDVATPVNLSNTVFTDLGCVAAGSGMVYGLFEITLQAYQGNGGAWDIDAIRIVGTPCAATGIAELAPPAGPRSDGTGFDVLGRMPGARPAAGAYIGTGKRVVVE